ncbi:hypothetical protein LguiA_002917 [Lonicera macranthoides]
MIPKVAQYHLTANTTTNPHILLPSIIPCTHFSSKSSLSRPIIHTITQLFNPPPRIRRAKQYPSCRFSFRPLATATTTSQVDVELGNNVSKPFPAEVSRTVMELSSVGTLSTLTQQGWPLGIGVRFAVDPEGTPILCFNNINNDYASSTDTRSTLHVQLEQCGVRTPQCTIQGSLEKPQDIMVLKKLQSIWRKRFEEEVADDLLYVVAVERVLQIDDFMEDGTWVSPSDYKLANPDPLRDFSEKIVDEINTHNMEDIRRFCNVYADLNFQVSDAKVVWVDRLGFDMRISCPEKEVYEVRIPFPREVTDEKGAKSSFNCMSQLAWEVEKSYHAPDFNKVKQLKKITTR